MRVLTFITDSMRGADGKPSSKRVSAFLFCGLICIIVLTILTIGWLSTFRQVELKTNTLDLLKFIGGTVLLYLLMAVGALFGVQGWQQVSSLKIMNPAPPDKKVTITQEGDQPSINVDNAEIKKE
jgi:hypothetical protein